MYPTDVNILLDNSKMWFSVILNDSTSIKPSLIVLSLKPVKVSFDLKVLYISLHNKVFYVRAVWSLEKEESKNLNRAW